VVEIQRYSRSQLEGFPELNYKINWKHGTAYEDVNRKVLLSKKRAE
jgi:hypothetical protein